MERFAKECITSLQRMTKELEVSLGPDTAELCMRIGLHSGPGMLLVAHVCNSCVPELKLSFVFFHHAAVTAGVLRGERARFQLFGDTMNTAR